MRPPTLLIVSVALLLGHGLAAQPPQPPPRPPTYPALPSETPSTFEPVTTSFDYERRDVMIPMRDGVRLHTVVLVPKGARNAPILLTRTPYDATALTSHSESAHLGPILSGYDNAVDVIVEGGYIRVFQDVRGKHKSEGDYVMTRPLRGPLNDSKVDHSTDAYDSIDWLVKHVKESNGKVGMIGSSYEGFTVLMALVNPHPALKVAVPMSPMVDGWKGDDWFHNGAFRQTNFDYIYGQTAAKDDSKQVPRGAFDDYASFLRFGSAGDYARHFGFDQLGFWNKVSEHPAYDAYWQGQALDPVIAAQPLTVPRMIVASIWDQEDMYGAIATYEATEPKDSGNDKNFLVLGPWRHSGVNYDGSVLGVLKFNGDTAQQFRRDVMKPFLDTYLKDGAPKADTPPVFVYETGTNRWLREARWPLSCAQGCAAASKPLYLRAGGRVDFARAADGATFDEYVSDPAKPVPYQPRPVHFEDSDAWRRWLVVDQRFVDGRPDVLSYTSEPLTASMKIAGAPVVNLYASTSGTDSDWVVKLIDVYPDEVGSQADLGGYQLGVAMDIFRGRYRESLEHPSAVPPDQVQKYRFELPNADHVFLPGHRIMLQVQSSWFPLYDRNPQSYVDNVFFAKAADYRKATQRIYTSGDNASFVELPVVATP